MEGEKDVLAAAMSSPETHIKLADPNEDTYWGRVHKTFCMLDFRTAFTTERELAEAQELLAAHRRGESVDPIKLEHAKYVTLAIVHPDTGKPVFTPLRASVIVPMNMIMDGAMLLANSTKTTVFAQWLNQTYNALHYYANRNASNEDTAQQRAVAYVGATASSVGASLGIRRVAKQMTNAKWAPVVARMGPFAAVAAADLLNMAVMRQSEYLHGVHVYDENGDHVGKSRRCGALAVASCATGRIFAAAPILLLPPLILSRVDKHSTLFTRPKTRWLRVPALLGLVGCAIQFSVPLTFGLFRQTAQLDNKYLEPELQHAKRKQDGQPSGTSAVFAPDMEGEKPSDPDIDGDAAAELFNRQVDQQKLVAMAARVTQLQDEDAELRARHDKREQETHEFVAYFQKEIQTRDKQLTKLGEELAAARLSHALALEQMQQARDTERQHFIQQATAKEETSTEQIFYLREELHQLELFREMKDSVATKLKDLETQLTLEREQARDTAGALERKFLEEKARLQKEHEKKIELVKQQAKEDARNGLDADTRKIVTDNKRMGEELRFQLQMTEELQREKQQFEARAKTLNVELQLQVQKEAEFAKQAQRQSRELTQLRASLRETEHKLGAGLAAASWDAHAHITRHEREREELTLDVEGLRKLLSLKNRELRNLRRLAQAILSQRTDVEQFFLDSLEHVKREIERERKEKRERDLENYHRDVNCAQGIKHSLRFPKLTSPTSPVTANSRKGLVPPTSPQHFTEKVDLRKLSWEDRERVLRLVFSKINHSQSFVNVESDAPPEVLETPPKQSRRHNEPSPNQREKQRSTAVYFATEPTNTGEGGRSTAGSNTGGDEMLSMSLSGMPLVPRVPTRSSIAKGK
ncbi:hypothetical protein BBJ29_006794 [Phytophthora kernoviae]|uniref:Uncharacterized protein n=1 Tax=Phytophthora kernoviae TaxID=325452 RepID=A0A3F2RGU6_9STRA|nr:hypothetical protein BBP00_00008457 [Phytophthora kernoviae]RLN70358.1 hypothetical protein BBJ29_006794 [Phytophthora kernoviae]